MTRRDVVAFIRAMRDTDGRSEVKIERLSGGKIVFGVKATGRSLRQTRAKAVEAFKELEETYGKPSQ